MECHFKLNPAFFLMSQAKVFNKHYNDQIVLYCAVIKRRYSVMMLTLPYMAVKGLRLIYHVLHHAIQIPKYTTSSVSDTGSMEPLVFFILQQFNNI